MEVLHTCPDIRYWSKVLCCTAPTHISDQTKKKIDMIQLKFLQAKHDSGKLRCPATAPVVICNKLIHLECKIQEIFPWRLALIVNKLTLMYSFVCQICKKILWEIFPVF